MKRIRGRRQTASHPPRGHHPDKLSVPRLQNQGLKLDLGREGPAICGRSSWGQCDSSGQRAVACTQLLLAAVGKVCGACVDPEPRSFLRGRLLSVLPPSLLSKRGLPGAGRVPSRSQSHSEEEARGCGSRSWSWAGPTWILRMVTMRNVAPMLLFLFATCGVVSWCVPSRVQKPTAPRRTPRIAHGIS